MIIVIASIAFILPLLPAWDVRGLARRHRLKALGISDGRLRKDLSRRAARMIVIPIEFDDLDEE